MFYNEKTINNLVESILLSYSPNKIYLFGSYSNGTATAQSDVDLCIVMESEDKRKILTDMYFSLDTDKPFDLLLYTPHEWEQCVRDESSFAYHINKKGVLLYGG